MSTEKKFPEEGELVLCTVDKIMGTTVFIKIEEYGLMGTIATSEIASGRIRNIRDYVVPNKKIVCKVLRINRERENIDLSLRRVNERERKTKVNAVKFEQKAESIIEHVAKANNIPTQKLYEDISKVLLKDYAYLHHAFEDVVAGVLSLSTLPIDKKISAQIEELVNQRFKAQSIEISGVLSITSYDSNGIEIVKSALIEAENASGAEIKYLGGGKYKVIVKAPDYKEAEPKMKQATELALAYIHKHKGIAEFKRH